MKSAEEYIQSLVTEAQAPAGTIPYTTNFIGTKDEDGIPYTVTIYVPRKYKADFEKFAEKEQDNIFQHMDGGDLEF